MCENGAESEPKEKFRRKFQINKTTGGTLKQAFLLLIKKFEKNCEKALTKVNASIIMVVSIRPKEDNEVARNTEEQAYGKYGTLAKIYLEEHEPARYWALGKDLPDYLHGIDRQAGEMYDTMYEKLSAKEEYKKTGDYLADVRKENEMRKIIEEEILAELVYVK